MKPKAKQARLDRRRKAYEDTLKDRARSVTSFAFHRPGSMNK